MNSLIPSVKRQISSGDGSVFSLPASLSAELGGFEPYCVAAFCERSALPLESGGCAWLLLERDGSLEPEGYSLAVCKDCVRVKASCERGVIFALTTLFELMDGSNSAPVCELEDKPKYPHRGLSVDCARHFFPLEAIKRVVEQLSLVKMNVLHWHLADDQGWRVESKKYPRLNETGGEYYTQDELRELVEYARLRGVEVVPEIDMPGHTLGILAAYPEYSCAGKELKLASCAGIFRTILCPGKESTFEFLEGLFDEICPIFPSERFHIGGDEAPKSEWLSCPDCRRRMEELGLTEIEDLQGYFTARMVEILKKHGKKAICWNDSLLASNLPEGVQIQYWSLEHAKQMQSFIERGGEFYYSDMFEIYLDYPHSMSSLKKAYNVKPHVGKLSCEGAKGLLGIECCMWAERVETPERLEELLFPRVYAVAEAAWSGSADYRDFKRRAAVKCGEAKRMGVNCTPELMWDPKGKARRTELIALIDGMKAQMTPESRAIAKDTIKPSKEFVKSFVTKFLKPGDLPLLFRLMK